MDAIAARRSADDHCGARRSHGGCSVSYSWRRAGRRATTLWRGGGMAVAGSVTSWRAGRRATTLRGAAPPATAPMMMHDMSYNHQYRHHRDARPVVVARASRHSAVADGSKESERHPGRCHLTMTPPTHDDVLPRDDRSVRTTRLLFGARAGLEHRSRRLAVARRRSVGRASFGKRNGIHRD